MSAESNPTERLRDKYVKRQGKILLTGVQALVRLMLLQAEKDAAAGVRSGGFVSGYRGSPLGTLDNAFKAVEDLTRERRIKVLPAVNEELAATAVAGTQQIDQTPGAAVEGVFALWYGKGPGLDRAADAIRHGNVAGSSAKGGVLLAVGDDHIAKSSTITCYSDDTVASLQLPLLFPADAQELIHYGLHGFALSRHTGSWAALKILPELADSTHTVCAGEAGFQAVLPNITVPPSGLHVTLPDTALVKEARQQEYRLPAVLAYVRANGLDRSIAKGASSRVGIVAAGKTWLDVQESLRLLGLGDRLHELGIALYKPAMIWPLEPHGLQEFASGLAVLIVVEEKGPLVENQLKARLYQSDSRPAVFGKEGPDGARLFASTADLSPEIIAATLGKLLQEFIRDPPLAEVAANRQQVLRELQQFATAPLVRPPFFCPGCPHNRSTVTPAGSRAIAGIGCHGLASFFVPRTASFAQMGGEGIHWVGLAPFTSETHVFANLGDGTYFHSGILAIRQAVAAGVNLTYKVLYNDAVAMTGGQAVDGALSVPALVDQLWAEGIRVIVIVTDDVAKYDVARYGVTRSAVTESGVAGPEMAGSYVAGHGEVGHALRARARIEHRDNLEGIQLELRETPGVSVIIYEQMCATERRRKRKRGRLPQAAKRVFINERVCEGCGDCSRQSNCLAVEPVETAFGVKRRINQSSCNEDYSCLQGFCPSFVTVEGARPRRNRGTLNLHSDDDPLPEPPALPPPHHQRIIVAGIGGTGVVTIGALISMAAHLNGQHTGVLDQVGLAQKGGAVLSHIHVAAKPLDALRIACGEADLVLVADQVVGNSKDVMGAIAPGRTQVIANSNVAVTGAFTRDRDAIPAAEQLSARLRARVGAENFFEFPFSRVAEGLLGDTLGSNLMMVGVAWQKGWLSMDLAPFEAAVTANGVAREMNLRAFRLGRQIAVAPAKVLTAATLRREGPQTLVELVETCSSFLASYQDEAYAERWRGAVGRVQRAEEELQRAEERSRSAERPLPQANGRPQRAEEQLQNVAGRPGLSGLPLTEAAARALFKLMAYKDEYEVARLYTDGAFEKRLREEFEGDTRVRFHFAAPLLSRRDPRTGELRKSTYGAWILPGLRLLARLRRLRGTRWDVFGYTIERRAERALIASYEATLEQVTRALRHDNLQRAIAIARLPLEIRGYGHIKWPAIEHYQRTVAAQMTGLSRPATAAIDARHGAHT